MNSSAEHDVLVGSLACADVHPNRKPMARVAKNDNPLTIIGREDDTHATAFPYAAGYAKCEFHFDLLSNGWAG